MPKLVLNINEAGMGRVYLDGRDVSASISKITIAISAGELTKIDLDIIAGIDGELEAKAENFKIATIKDANAP